LPNNPELARLTSIQRYWILANLLEEMGQLDAFNKRGKQVMGLETDEFKEFSKKMRELAEKQRG
jgi:hypothetical protein